MEETVLSYLLLTAARNFLRSPPGLLASIPFVLALLFAPQCAWTVQGATQAITILLVANVALLLAAGASPQPSRKIFERWFCVAFCGFVGVWVASPPILALPGTWLLPPLTMLIGLMCFWCVRTKEARSIRWVDLSSLHYPVLRIVLAALPPILMDAVWMESGAHNPDIDKPVLGLLTSVVIVLLMAFTEPQDRTSIARR